MSCGVGRRRGSDPALLWLWRRLVATAPIRPLAWEPPYAAEAAQRNSKKKKQKKKKKMWGVSVVAQWLMNPTRNHEVAGSVPALAQWVNDALSCGVGCRRGSDTALLWLWRRPAATAPIRPLAWEPPYAVGAALEKTKRQNKQQTMILKSFGRINR